MKIVLILLIGFIMSLTAFGQQMSVKQIETIGATKNAYHPLFAPDGNNIYYSTENYIGLWRYNTENKISEKLNDHSGAGFSPVFTDNGNSIVYRKEEFKNRRKYSSIVSFNLNKKTETVLEEQNRYLTRPVKSTAGDIVYKKKNKFYVYDSKLKNKTNSFSGKLIDLKNSNLVVYENNNPITLNFSNENQYLWASLSPNQSKILFTKAGIGTYISDLQGNILVKLGYANAPVWSPDGNWIAYMVDKDDGHQITSSDIYVISQDGSQKYQITKTENEIEMYPHWSPDDSRLIFHTISGKIKIAHLEVE